jgi:hypothetical protein
MGVTWFYETNIIQHYKQKWIFPPIKNVMLGVILWNTDTTAGCELTGSHLTF